MLRLALPHVHFAPSAAPKRWPTDSRRRPISPRRSSARRASRSARRTRPWERWCARVNEKHPPLARRVARVGARRIASGFDADGAARRPRFARSVGAEEESAGGTGPRWSRRRSRITAQLGRRAPRGADADGRSPAGSRIDPWTREGDCAMKRDFLRSPIFLPKPARLLARRAPAQGEPKAPWKPMHSAGRGDRSCCLREAEHAHARLVRGRHRAARRAPITLPIGPSQLARGEPIDDTARVVSRLLRRHRVPHLDDERLRDVGEGRTVPVVNALSDDGHPVQVLADVFTLESASAPARRQRSRSSATARATWRARGSRPRELFDFELRSPRREGYRPVDPGDEVRHATDTPPRRSRAPTWSSPTCGRAWARRRRTPRG